MTAQLNPLPSQSGQGRSLEPVSYTHLDVYKRQPVKCDERGNIDMADLKSQAEAHKDNLSCIMVTYPSTHGLFTTIRSSRGEDIFAACGMLSTAKQEENNKS